MTTIAVDGHHNLHRCLHVPAFQEFSCNGSPTGGIYGGLQVVRSTLDKFNAKRCIVVWDGCRPEYRSAIYPDYKANREPKTEEERVEKVEHKSVFLAQKTLLTTALRYLGCAVVEVEEAEGDDLLCAIVQLSPTEKIVLISEDMDLAQLVDQHVSLYRPGREVLVEYDNFAEATGIQASQFLLYKALVGDTSDNIKGVKGVGKKRAGNLLHECPTGNLDQLRSYCATHKSVPIRRVAETFGIVLRNLKIMDLQEFPWSTDRLREIRDQLDNPPSLDETAARGLFEELQFHSILATFSSWITPFKLLGR
jgi:DNA polymerase-1